MISKKTMEINPDHPIIRTLKDRITKDATDQTTRDLVLMLFDTSLLTSGFAIDDATSYASRIHKMIRLAITDDGDEEDAAPEPAAASADVPPAAADAGKDVSAMEDVD